MSNQNTKIIGVQCMVCGSIHWSPTYSVNMYCPHCQRMTEHRVTGLTPDDPPSRIRELQPRRKLNVAFLLNLLLWLGIGLVVLLALWPIHLVGQ